MRKRYVKTVAHWVIMCFLLLFPIVMVGISSFSNSETVVDINYKYETNNVFSSDDLVEGNIYNLKLNKDINWPSSIVYFDAEYYSFIYKNNANSENYVVNFDSTLSDYKVRFGILRNSDTDYRLYSLPQGAGNVWYSLAYIKDFKVVFNDSLLNEYFTFDMFSICENIPIESVSYDYFSMRSEVNNWINDFRSLPINFWYDNLLTAMKIPFTDNALMSVLYIYPLYVIWVYIFDLITDLFLMLVKIGHNALEKLGADND